MDNTPSGQSSDQNTSNGQPQNQMNNQTQQNTNNVQNSPAATQQVPNNQTQQNANNVSNNVTANQQVSNGQLQQNANNAGEDQQPSKAKVDVDKSQQQVSNGQTNDQNNVSGEQKPYDSNNSSESVTPHTQIEKLEKKVKDAKLPEQLNDNAMAMIGRLKLIEKESNFFAEYDTISRYIKWITYLPWNNASKDILDLKHAQQVFNKNHHGLDEVKEKILEYLSIMILTRSRLQKDAIARAPILSLVGLVGTGKTTIAKSISEALGREFVRIPFGGMGSASQLRGKSRMMPDSEPGMVIKALRQAGTNNPVILLDEIDRVSASARADIMGVLIELLDPEQNQHFSDHFIDYPFDLSNVLFVATSNNTKDISTAVLDRMQIIQMPSYSDDEKIYIGKNYLFPEVMKESGLKPEELAINDNVWPEIVRPLGYDSGIRSLKRSIQGLVRKVVHFYLIGKIPQGKQFVVTKENLSNFISKW